MKGKGAQGTLCNCEILEKRAELRQRRRPYVPRRRAPAVSPTRGAAPRPGTPGAAAGSGVHLRPAPISARASSASPLLTAPGLIFHRSAASVWGRLPPRHLVLCTALSPFPAISNLHALSDRKSVV